MKDGCGTTSIVDRAELARHNIKLTMWQALENIVSPSHYMPHGNCYLWETPLVWLHVTSDVLIAVAYFSIPAMLLYFAFKRQDVPFLNVFILFGAFIILCGAGHLLEVWTLWHPAYWLSGVEQAATALISCATAASMVTLLPQFLSLKTPEQLEEINQELRKEIDRRRKTEAVVQSIVTGTAAVTGEEFFPALVRYLARSLEVDYAIVSELTEDGNALRTLALWAKDDLADECTYALEGTPCQVVIDEVRVCHYRDKLQQQFPKATLLPSMGGESFVGVPLFDAGGQVVGNLCVIDSRPLDADEETKGILEVFASRASAELQRQKASRALNVANEELERRVRERTATLETEIRFRKAAEEILRDREERLSKQQQGLLELATRSSWYDGKLSVAFGEITRLAAETLNVERASIWFYGDEKTSIICHELYESSSDGHSRGVQLQAGDLPAYFAALASQETIAADDARQDPRTCEFREVYLEPLGITSMLDVPVRHRGETVGVLCLEHTAEPRHWTIDEQNFANYLSYTIALAIESHDRATAQAALEMALKETERSSRLLRTVIDATPDWIFAKDKRFRYILVNQGYADALKTTPQAMLGKTDLEVGFDRDLVFGNLDRDLVGFRHDDTLALGGRIVHNANERATDAEGNLRIFDTKKFPLADDNGEIFAMLGFAHDVTDRETAQRALRQSQSQLEKAQSIAHIGSWEFDLDSGEIFWSRELFDIHGWPGEDPPNFDELIEMVHPDDREAWVATMTRVMEDGIPYSIDYRLIRPDGQLRYLNGRGEVQRDESGQSVWLFGTAMDITDRKLAEEQVRQQLRRERLVAATLERVWSSLKLQEVLQAVVEEIRAFLNVDRVVIYRFHADWSGYVEVESVADGWMQIQGRDIQDECFDITYAPLYQDGRVRAVENIETSDLAECHKNLLRGLQVKANLAVPILWQPNGNPDGSPKLWGLTIAHSCSGPRVWRDFEIECLEQLDVQLGIALRQHDLFDRLQRELAERKKAEAALRASEAQERAKAMELQLTLKKLQRTQAQLIQSEKMASLGQMVAGVAHEINNPVSFIYGNITYAEEYTRDLFELIDLYRDSDLPPNGTIADKLETLDVDFIKEDFPQLLDSMKVGADRIKKIVLSLRNFSRLDEADRKVANINDCIESTLTMISGRLSAQPQRRAIEVTQTLEKLPEIECYPGQLNQALLNILNNAIDALEERFKQEPNFEPRLEITSTVRDRSGKNKQQPDPRIEIRIRDNGLGIPEAVREKIFDPFFTTKPIGKGTGMGLSVAYQIIVDRHGGQFECRSTPGEGTTFVIQVPTHINR